MNDQATDREVTLWQKLQQSAGNLLVAVVMLSVIAMLAGLLGRWHFLLDIASHFRIQATAAVLGCALVLLALRRRRAGVISLSIGVCLALSLAPYYWPTAPITEKTYRLLTANVLTRNENKKALLRLIDNYDPDFVLLQETDRSWTDAVEQHLSQVYPHRKLVPRNGNFGIAMLSKYPWASCENVTFSPATEVPSLIAEIEMPDGKELCLIATHPLPPMRHRAWADRNDCLVALADEVQRRGSARTIVAGDLNCTPWSYWFRRLLSTAQLKDSGVGFGLSSTWKPVKLPLAGLVIDHVLVGSGVDVANRLVGPYFGSDHRAVIVDFR